MRYFIYKTAYFMKYFFKMQHTSCTQHRRLRHYATSWKIAGSIPDEVFGFFN
jgi:hypothetical protein